ncbi:hypothetical protein MJO28_017311 [Puccinia striiformis f. sp. tritici]|uniref:Uncharacterized protein n=1 Tax=Puccinia striiformis TaxID=27350 RepID=A0A2S4UZM9_9BASI|nr:hypothetical protein MJO28_017311 [Puccinia striiformis f. sp. tritici]POW02711.1 hypothetical protein PSTT_11633 [Puccinia striiformis]
MSSFTIDSEIPSSQNRLHRHALLLKLIRDALALNLDIPAQSAPQTRDSIQRQASVNAFCQDIHTLASVSAFKPRSDSDSQESPLFNLPRRLYPRLSSSRLALPPITQLPPPRRAPNSVGETSCRPRY